jgi:RNA polymerase sigma-70 factor (ECF subfamily)
MSRRFDNDGDGDSSDKKPLSTDHKQTQTLDTELILAIKDGDEGAIAILYDRYKSVLFGFLLRTLNNNGEAEDVLQEVFVHVWRKAADFDATRGRIFTWLTILARSRAIDRLRARNSRERTATRASRETSDYSEGVIENAIRSEEGEMVRSALEEIPEENRRVLWLAYFEGLSQSEIAAATGKPLGTVKTRTRTGLKRLRDLLHRKMLIKSAGQSCAQTIRPCHQTNSAAAFQ